MFLEECFKGIHGKICVDKCQRDTCPRPPDLYEELCYKIGSILLFKRVNIIFHECEVNCKTIIINRKY